MTAYIDRSKAELPVTFMPSAKKIALVDEFIVYLVHPMPLFGQNPPSGWRLSGRNDLFRNVGANGYILYVRRYGEVGTGYEGMWGIERQRFREEIPEVLAFDFRPTPIFLKYPQEAIFVAKSCHPTPRQEAQCLRWVPITV